MKKKIFRLKKGSFNLDNDITSIRRETSDIEIIQSRIVQLLPSYIQVQ